MALMPHAKRSGYESIEPGFVLPGSGVSRQGFTAGETPPLQHLRTSIAEGTVNYLAFAWAPTYNA
jgi:hypothetical protein